MGTIEQDKNKVVEEKIVALRKAAEQGDAEAQLHLGKCYLGKICVNFAEAEKWLLRAAKQGHVVAQYELGDFYYNLYYHWLNAEDADFDYYIEGLKWLHKAAERGYADAQCKLGTLYLNGVYEEDEEGNGSYIGQSDTEAFKWLHKAAEQGHTVAQYKLGESYQFRDDAEALKWFSIAAEQGHDKAQYELGHSYYSGDWVVDKDYTKAAKWLLKAAEQENSDAQYELGNCYYYGLGVVEDKSEARKWFRKAAEHGNVRAKNMLNGDCYITTAICKEYGKSDDCYELRMFRSFRDTWLKKQPDGEQLIKRYYATAPTLVQLINKQSDRCEIYRNLNETYLSRCLKYIEDGENIKCRELYIDMVNFLCNEQKKWNT